MINLLRLFPHHNPLVKQLANRLSPQAGKSLVIPQAEEEANESLREFLVTCLVYWLAFLPIRLSLPASRF